ncbi:MULTISPECIES: hypothetical protein [unclassified Coleofasciculus]|uniref:hypothetical protein n=1 Tax=unclassified Coleofasciculus TaxID=2692782 RepID=UPI0018828477|nr:MULTISPECIES: hypothetical protein [unclassified Coleofasciculus]MBE9126476.1 hypothetical protein [Coleofasciculus sp. LEGE 07081]MBE9148914.1 hypothetical protein [Coleofasciculus sp. LEGE 07092]
MDAKLEQARTLKQALTEFVLEAEGELAVALEEYAAQQLHREPYDINHRNLTIDTFITEGRVGAQTPLELFLESHPDLTKSDRALVSSWQQNFIGLFEVTQILPDGLELMNWLTAKHYTIKPSHPTTVADKKGFKPGEILLTRIAPVTDTYWMFSAPAISKGKLGKPKLAVAIGEFKKNYKHALYSDAPELLQEAWDSVARYHEEFVDFFGSDRVTLPGYQLNKKLAELREKMTKERLAAAGIDESKSLQDVIRESGTDEEEVKAAVLEAGGDAKDIDKILNTSGKSPMMMPKVDLPDEITKAEQVTVLTHPRWGQMFIPTYSKFRAMLEAEDWQSQPNAEALVRKYLEDSQINAFIWQQLAQEYPTQLETVLQTVLERPDFSVQRDLDATLQEFNKPLEPELPEVASVPIHLHNLFEVAVAEVHKTKSKGKGKKKGTKGFQ